MPRRARFVLPGTPHHITQRGNRRQNVFFSNQDRSRYLELVRQHSLRHNLRILAWCLMTNHIHLIVVPGHANSMGLALREAHSRYSLEVNQAQGWDGHLWQNRFFSCALADENFLTAVRYVEQNPVRAGLVAHASDWPWSSARAHGSAGAQDNVLDWEWQRWMQDARGGCWSHEDWLARLATEQREEQLEQIRRATRLGEPLGSEAFVDRMEKLAGRRLRVWKPGRPKTENRKA
jgi:putative transposase